MLRFLLSVMLVLAAASARAFGFEDVAREAARVAAQPYQPVPVDARLAALGYDDYRSIRFRREFALWREGEGGFQVNFYPLGAGQARPLQLHEIVDGTVRPVDVPAAAFRNDASNGVVPAPGAAGWRLNFPLNRPDVSDELIVFLGASYFRVLGAGLQYGLSARGLAIDTVGGPRGEEFPVFTRFWLERPAPGATEARFYALLDSPRAAGAYAFTIRPGAVTTVDVRARVTLREPVAMLGIAPLTSMFQFGENQPLADDYRPEVHDSDGLQVRTAAGEWLWRPLVNPPGVFVTSFALHNPRGFGLMQRDRAFVRYEDLEARYDLRPSAWVEPLGDWGHGRVELLQFHTPDETQDNVGAYWVPAALPAPGEPLELAWRLHVGGEGLAPPPNAWVTQSRRGHGYRAAKPTPNQLQFHVDFAGPALDGLGPDAVQAVASANGNAGTLRAIAQPHAARGGWRVTLDVERLDVRTPLDLRLFLKSGDRTLSETWSYALPPES